MKSLNHSFPLPKPNLYLNRSPCDRPIKASFPVQQIYHSQLIKAFINRRGWKALRLLVSCCLTSWKPHSVSVGKKAFSVWLPPKSPLKCKLKSISRFCVAQTFHKSGWSSTCAWCDDAARLTDISLMLGEADTIMSKTAYKPSPFI